MDNEEFTQPPQMSLVLKTAALNMIGNMILVLGIVFVLLGIAFFVTDFLGIKGSGEFLVGLVLCVISIIVYKVSTKESKMIVPPPPPPPPSRPPVIGEMDKKDESASYR